MEGRNKSLWLQLTKLILAGAAALGPLVGTIWLLYIIYKLLLKVGESLVDFLWRFVLYLSNHASAPPQFPGVGFLHFLLPLLILLGAGFFLATPSGTKGRLRPCRIE